MTRTRLGMDTNMAIPPNGTIVKPNCSREYPARLDEAAERGKDCIWANRYWISHYWNRHYWGSCWGSCCKDIC